jgi:hypothetical protein
MKFSTDSHGSQNGWSAASRITILSPRGVQKRIAEILAEIHGDAQPESAGLSGQLGDQCCR